MKNKIISLINSLEKHLIQNEKRGIYHIKNYKINVKKEDFSLEANKKISLLKKVEKEVNKCAKCPLFSSKTNYVFGEGNPDAELVFVGEAPGADEDRMGRPFVGRAGQLLTKIIKAMNLERKDVYICNILKCRPPGNRTPLPTEIFECRPYLYEQLDIIKPKVICALGSVAAQVLLETKDGITKLRGKFYDYRGSKLLPTYHPAYLLRNPNKKKETWEDMQIIMKYLGIEIKK